MKRGSTLFLRSVIILIGLFVLVLCIIVLPAGLMETDMYSPILAGLYLPAVPFFYALYQAILLLDRIDKNQAFSQPAVEALKRIKYCGAAISGIFALGMPYIFYTADKDDAPGVVLIGLVITFTALVVATAAAVFQRLLQNAVDIKSENDLTV